MASLREQLLRRKPVAAMTEETGADTEDVEWQEGDLLVVGSSSTGPIARVFLGSRSSKIVRDSPVPVVVFPR